MYIISKEFHFAASHQLVFLAADRPDHPCARLHGHNYVVQVTVISEILNEDGFVMDYNDMKIFQNWIDETLDHQHLNVILESFDGRATTAEALANYLFHVFVELCAPYLPEGYKVSVAVKETPKTRAVYTL